MTRYERQADLTPPDSGPVRLPHPPGWALEYTISAPDGASLGPPTSVEPVLTADGGARQNEDVSKNAALVPPGFGTPTSYFPGSGAYLTPDLAPEAQAILQVPVQGSLPTQTSPAVSGFSTLGTSTAQITVTWSGDSFTEVTEDLYYSGGYLGWLEIPALDREVQVYQGTDTAALRNGAGHFEETSIWGWNVVLAGHNRGNHPHFSGIWDLELGDELIYTTKLGTRTYEVVSVEQVDVLDRSGLAASWEDRLTLYTCVAGEPDLRWEVVAVVKT